MEPETLADIAAARRREGLDARATAIEVFEQAAGDRKMIAQAHQIVRGRLANRRDDPALLSSLAALTLALVVEE